MKTFQVKYTVVITVEKATTQIERAETIEADSFCVDSQGGISFFDRKGDPVASYNRNRWTCVKEINR